MYPTLTDLIRDLFGVTIPLPVQTFGFVMFFSFAAAYWAFSSELKRKEREGLITKVPYTHVVGKKATVNELLLNGLVGFLLGYKLPYIVGVYSQFTLNPSTYLFNMEGNWLGAIIGAGILAYWSYYERKKVALEVPKTITDSIHPYELMGNAVLIAAGAGLVGAKVFDNLENWDRFMSDPIGNLFSGSGLTFYGGLIFGSIGVLWYMNKNGIKPRIMLDVGGPGMMLAYATGRIGCHLAGDGDWGIPNTSPKPGWMSFLPDWVWAYNYPHNVNNEGIPIPGCTGNHCYMLSPPVFPTPFYEVVVCMGLFIALWLIRKKIKVPGVLFSIYLIMNGVERFLVELIRVNTKYHLGSLAFTQAELISLLLVITGIVGILYCYKHPVLKQNTTPKNSPAQSI